jgi:lysophospholipase L1-like esterase
MISTLLASLAEWFRGRGPVFSIVRRKRLSERFASPPTVEVLEARCLPSVTTTVPPLSEIPPGIALMDYLFATQAKGNPSVVFVGDSISYQYAYGPGAPVWAKYMAPLGMSDYGVSGQTTQSLLFQLSLGQLVGIHPSVVVLDIGANDLLQGNSPQDSADGVLADLATIQQYQPLAHVVVLAVLPGEQSPSDPYRSLGAQTNQLVSQTLAGNPQVTYVNFGSIFLQPDGTISNSMLYDYLHPSEQGYLDLTNALLPIIEQYLFPNLSALPSTTSTSPPSSSVPISPS